MATRNDSREVVIDIDLVAQRVLKLAEIATLDHLDSLARSQADALVSLFESPSAEWSSDRRSA